MTKIMHQILRLVQAAVIAVLVSCGGSEAAEEERPTLQRQFQAYHSDVYVIRDFLPKDLALDWRRRMYESWKDTETLLGCMADSNDNNNDNMNAPNSDDGQCCSNSDEMMTTKNNSFHYATNNDGSEYRKNLVFVNNAKTRSLNQIQQRNITAHQMRQDQKFSYAKWELLPTHNLVEEMEDYFVKQSTRDLIIKVLSKDHPNLKFQSQLADLFVTYYGKGDFLFTHDDAFGGTWAFVISLAQLPENDDSGSWDKGMGGTLQFQCPYDKKNENGGRVNKNSPEYFCEELIPSFNTAVIFNTRLIGFDGRRIFGPDHQVLPVLVPPESGYFRFGLTGWFMDVDDIMDDKTKAELNKVRGRD